MNVEDVCMVPYPGFGNWPGKVLASLRAGKVRVGLFPHLEETVVTQSDTLKPLPGKMPKAWKKGKKSAYQVARKAASSKDSPEPQPSSSEKDNISKKGKGTKAAKKGKVKDGSEPQPSSDEKRKVKNSTEPHPSSSSFSSCSSAKDSPEQQPSSSEKDNISEKGKGTKAAIDSPEPEPSSSENDNISEMQAAIDSPEPESSLSSSSSSSKKRKVEDSLEPQPSSSKKRKVKNSTEPQPSSSSSSSSKKRKVKDSLKPQPSSSKKRKVKNSTEPQPSSSSPEPQLSPSKDSPSLDTYINYLSEKFEEGNKSRGDKQERNAKGTFGQKSFWDCSWRTWIKRMYMEHPDVIFSCTCNDLRPISTGQALIKHIERKHYVDSVVSFGDASLRYERPVQSDSE